MTEVTMADIYCRTATEDQTASHILDTQEEICRQYCLENGLSVGTVYRDVFSGYHYRGRKQLNAMRSHYQEGITRGVVVTTLDRLSRSLVHQIILLEEMEEYGITIHTVQERLYKTPPSVFVKEMVDIMSAIRQEKERESSSDDSEL